MSKKRTADTVDIPGLGKVPVSTVKRWAPKIGALLLGRMLSRAPSAGSSRRSAAPSQGGPYFKWIVLIFVVALLVWWLSDGGAQICADALRRLREPGVPTAAEDPASAPGSPAAPPEGSAKAKRGAAKPAAPETLKDGLWWEGRGVVEKVLPDDTEPPRHQRFLLRDDRGRSLFFAHNIDEAPRVPDLKEGDEISFRGEWRDNEMGGAMHWTHRAGGGRRKGGWLERAGVRYE